MSVDTALLTEIRDLLRLIAEPAIAKRDEKQRESLLGIVGKSRVRAKAILLMDGSRSQADLVKELGIDKGGLSRLTKALRDGALIEDDQKYPKLTIPIHSDIFQNLAQENG